MAISRRENPNLFVRALTLAGMRAVESRPGWQVLVHPERPGVVVAIPLTQPLDPKKIESYLDASGIPEADYLRFLEQALREPPDPD